jgi:hypothetical protein
MSSFFAGAALTFVVLMFLFSRDVKARRELADQKLVDTLRALASNLELRLKRHPADLEVPDYFADKEFEVRARLERPNEFLIVEIIRELAKAREKTAAGMENEAAHAEVWKKLDDLQRPLAAKARSAR